jgi:hypothetical protein
MAVEPGAAQEIPMFAKFVILALCIVAVTLTAAWGKVMELMKGGSKKKAEPVTKESK